MCFFNFYITLYQSFSKITRLLRKIRFGGLLLYLIHFYQYIFMLKLSSVFSHDLKFSDLNQILSKPLTDNFCRTNEKGGCKINLWPKNPKARYDVFNLPYANDWSKKKSMADKCWRINRKNVSKTNIWQTNKHLADV